MFLEKYGTALAENYEFKSISDFFKFIEEIWQKEEAKASENTDYEIAPIFKAQNSYDEYKIPYDFECETIVTNDETRDDTTESNYTKIIISLRNFTKN